MAKQTDSKAQCSCSPGMGLLGLVLLATGIYFLVLGFMSHTGNPIIRYTNIEALLFYFLGAALYGFGHMCKHNGYHICEMHGLK